MAEKEKKEGISQASKSKKISFFFTNPFLVAKIKNLQSVKTAYIF